MSDCLQAAVVFLFLGHVRKNLHSLQAGVAPSALLSTNHVGLFLQLQDKQLPLTQYYSS